MSSMDKRKGSALKEPSNSGTLPQVPELVNELSPVEQLPFPEPSSIPNKIAQASPVTTPLASSIFEASPLTTRQLPGNTKTTSLPSPSATRVLPTVTQMLPETRTGDLPPLRTPTTSLRQPTVIRATGKKSSGTMRPPQGRRMVVHVAVTVLLAFIVLGSLIAVVPTGTEGKGYNVFSPIVKYFSNKSNNNVLLAQQAATATAVTQDGYDPGNSQTFAGVPTAPPSYGGGTGTGTGGGVNARSGRRSAITSLRAFGFPGLATRLTGPITRQDTVGMLAILLKSVVLLCLLLVCKVLVVMVTSLLSRALTLMVA